MNDIIVLWATPRSTSTAFEWMMRMRGDMACFHEPFGEAWYQGDEALWPRLQPDSPRTPGLTFASVLARLKNAAGNRKVFSKDMPQFTDHLWSDEFLGHFRHSFLIRHPAKVLTSVYRNWPEFDRKEIGFDDQRRLFDRLTDKIGAPPPLIDSDDLLENPHGLVEVYCDAVGIPFIADALSWQPGARSEVLWYDTNSVWHENLKTSDGLKPQPRRNSDVSKTPEWVQEMYADFLPHYEHMHAHRLTI
ncbi:MAG: sulfotransferase family protein [Rhizobiales bacterium]|nr:sulfotransferase family protein [Hyphomicrobiales bacterium]